MTDREARSEAEAGRSAAVKICGIREAETIERMQGLRVHHVGFVLAPSKRQVTPAQAAELIAVARRTPMAGGRSPRTVGVFVNPTMEQLANALAVAPLDVVQLHGDESPDFCREAGRRLGVEVWRALPADEEPEAGADHGPERLDAYRGAVSAVLLDTAGGGTGRAFCWEVIPAYREAARRNGLRLLVAGGLTPDNVRELLDTYEPDGVDVSSGVETDGRKDQDKIAAFAERAR